MLATTKKKSYKNCIMEGLKSPKPEEKHPNHESVLTSDLYTSRVKVRTNVREQ